MTPFVRIIGPKNSGKTCLVEALVQELSARGLRVGTIKHDAHEFTVDVPGKDSWRHRQAGAVATVICSETQLALMREVTNPPTVTELVERHFDDCDVVLVEGYKQGEGPAVCLGGLTVPGNCLAALQVGYDLTTAQISELADLVQTLLPNPDCP